MNVKGIRTQADLYFMFKETIVHEARHSEITYCSVELEYRIKPSRKRADLVLFILGQDDSIHPFLVIETKKSKFRKVETDYGEIIWLPELGEMTVREYIGKLIGTEGDFKYHRNALRQVQEYAKCLDAPFFAVCYANSLFIGSFVRQKGLFYSRVNYTRDFGAKILSELAQLYKELKSMDHK